MEQILNGLPSNRLQIVDVRSDDEFCGIDKRDNKKGGAIPGAKHLEWSNVIDQETQRFKGPEDLNTLFGKAGIDLTVPTASHCNGGGRAAVMAFTLELMGAKAVRNYYRGWGEWGNSDRTPVVVPEKTAP
jgi:thiosulfate/3-mercaptopyruvate sulfurtransferase